MTTILVVAPSWIGDTVLAQPLLSRLHEIYPDLAIDVLASQWGAPLFARMPEVRRVIDSPFRHGEFNLAGRWQLATRLKAAHYDIAIILPNSWKAALIPFLAGIPTRIGYRGESRFGLINVMHRLDRERHPRLVDRYAALAGPPGGDLPALRPPHLVSTPAQQRAAREALDLPLDGAPVVFCPGAEFGAAKRWPARHFAALASAVGHVDNPVWLVGSPKDATIGEKIEQSCHGAAINLCGHTTLAQAIDVIASARQVVCNDSGLMHVAAALQRPLVAVFGSSSFNYTPPISPQAKIVSLELECSPCFRRDCPEGHLQCLNDLTPERVLAAMRS
ncbi:MAG: lipopolysaccharide heptosyltransferase II [Rhodocyclaceae bacterium]|nr:lipopolysaccharide heptosyltransferase II [Rhodocyclaceae bacterium]